jgi:hypothetical protein
VAVRWSSRAAVSQLQVVDARLVNAHHCVIHAREDQQSMLTLRLVRRGLRLLGKGANYAQAERLFAQATACAQSGSGATSLAAWVASNAMGVRYVGSCNGVCGQAPCDCSAEHARVTSHTADVRKRSCAEDGCGATAGILLFAPSGR